jgi:hypothetical protein
MQSYESHSSLLTLANALCERTSSSRDERDDGGTEEHDCKVMCWLLGVSWVRRGTRP